MSKAKKITAALGLDGDTQSIAKLYQSWSQTYDQDLAVENYSGPHRTAQLAHHYWFLRHDDTNAKIFDAGCGTGLVGVELATLNYTDLIGADISEGMVAQAQLTNVYKQLHAPVDLNQPIARQIGTRTFDLVVCCGVFTLGHVPPASVSHLIDITRTGGYVVTSARAEYCEQFPFEATCNELQETGKIAIEYAQFAPYLNYDRALYSVMRVL